MELRQLYTFRAVATLASFSQAAYTLGYAQSTVSEHIKLLEIDLNTKLFNRDGKQVALTPAGELLLQYAQKMLNLEDEIRSELNGSDEIYGSLSIRIPETISTYYFPHILKNFHKRFPRVNFQFNSCSHYGLTEELRSGITNLAFLITNNFSSVGLDTIKLLKVPLAMVTYPENQLALKTSISLSEIHNGPLFAPSSDCSYFKIVESLFLEDKIPLPNILRINSVAAIKRNIIAGTGVAVLPRIAVQDELSKKLLVELNLKKGTLTADIVMIRLKNIWHPPILEAFMDITKKVLLNKSFLK
jgi:DNA-binding transcriptional LysR family regulator